MIDRHLVEIPLYQVGNLRKIQGGYNAVNIAVVNSIGSQFDGRWMKWRLTSV